jgi:hypothetical protein
MKLHYMCAVKACDILKVKDALVKPGYCVTECTICSTVSQSAPFAVLCHRVHHLQYCVTEYTICSTVSQSTPFAVLCHRVHLLQYCVTECTICSLVILLLSCNNSSILFASTTCVCIYVYIYIQWNLELRTQSVPGDGSTFKLFDFRVKFPQCKLN